MLVSVTRVHFDGRINRPAPSARIRGGSRIFLRRGAPVRNGVTDFWGRIPVVLESRRSSWRGGGVRTACTLPLDPPLCIMRPIVVCQNKFQTHKKVGTHEGTSRHTRGGQVGTHEGTSRHTRGGQVGTHEGTSRHTRGGQVGTHEGTSRHTRGGQVGTHEGKRRHTRGDKSAHTRGQVGTHEGESRHTRGDKSAHTRGQVGTHEGTSRHTRGEKSAHTRGNVGTHEGTSPCNQFHATSPFV